jgi:hypothetical protein
MRDRCVDIPLLFVKPSYPTIPLEPLQTEGVFQEICEKTETQAGGMVG